MAALTVRATLFTDPACPWAYSARPALARLSWRFGNQLDWKLVLIGLSETTERYVAMGYTPARQATGWATFQRRFGGAVGQPPQPPPPPNARAGRAGLPGRR